MPTNATPPPVWALLSNRQGDAVEYFYDKDGGRAVAYRGRSRNSKTSKTSNRRRRRRRSKGSRSKRSPGKRGGQAGG